MIQILSRHTKNNTVLIGDPGVGTIPHPKSRQECGSNFGNSVIQSLHLDGKFDTTESWHVDILESMVETAVKRPPILTPDSERYARSRKIVVKQ